MTFSTFTLSFGSLLLLIALIAAWLFRTANAPLATRIAVPALIVALACITPYQVDAMLGFPTSITPPDHAELIAYVAHDENKRVDLWLRSGPVPRVYDVPLDDRLKKTLRDAQSAMNGGERVMLRKGKQTRGVQGAPSPAPTFEIDDSAFSLPQKDRR